MSLPAVGTETASPECRATLRKRRLGTQRRASGGVAASGPCLEEEQPRSPLEPWPSWVTVKRPGSVQRSPADLGARVVRVRPDQNKRTRLPGGRQQVW